MFDAAAQPPHVSRSAHTQRSGLRLACRSAQEANKLEIPVIALCDTNCDPTGVDYVIPGNDDAFKIIRLFTSVIADACAQGAAQGRSEGDAVHGEDDLDVEIVERVSTPESQPDATSGAIDDGAVEEV